MTNRTLLIFAKSPRMGAAKTRLAADIGPAQAQRLNRFCHARAIACAKGPWRTYLCVAPDRDLAATHGGLWPSHIARRAQGGGDLGDRLARAMSAAAAGPIVVIGADAPDVSPALIGRAFQALRRADIAVGPADDGGFWLLGLNRAMRRRPAPFTNVRWSTAHALGDVLAHAPDAKIHRLPTLIDLDDAAALAAWRRL